MHDIVQRGRGHAVAGVDAEHFQAAVDVAVLEFVHELFYQAAMFRVWAVEHKHFHALSVACSQRMVKTPASLPLHRRAAYEVEF